MTQYPPVSRRSPGCTDRAGRVVRDAGKQRPRRFRTIRIHQRFSEDTTQQISSLELEKMSPPPKKEAGFLYFRNLFAFNLSPVAKNSLRH